MLNRITIKFHHLLLTALVLLMLAALFFVCSKPVRFGNRDTGANEGDGWQHTFLMCM